MIRYNLKLLDFNNNNIQKNWCLRNTRYIFWINKWLEASADLMKKYITNFDKESFDIGDTLVLDIWFKWLNSEWSKYWHIWVITEDKWTYWIMNDGTNSYPNLKIYKKDIRNKIWMVGFVTRIYCNCNWNKYRFKRLNK